MSNYTSAEEQFRPKNNNTFCYSPLFLSFQITETEMNEYNVDFLAYFAKDQGRMVLPLKAQPQLCFKSILNDAIQSEFNNQN